jgi:hypothetical protein
MPTLATLTLIYIKPQCAMYHLNQNFISFQMSPLAQLLSELEQI